MVQRSRQPSESDGRAKGKTSTPAASPVAPSPTSRTPASSVSTPTNSSVLPECKTLVKEADKVLRAVGFSWGKGPSVRKHLAMGNMVCSVIATKGDSELQQKLMRAATTIKTARLLSVMIKTTRKSGRVKSLHGRCSTCLPDKRDTVTLRGKKLQKHILTDNLEFLHNRYVAE